MDRISEAEDVNQIDPRTPNVKKLKRRPEMCEPGTRNKLTDAQITNAKKFKPNLENCEPSISAPDQDSFRRVKISKSKKLQGLPPAKAEAQRVKANQQERERQRALNQAFNQLRMLNMPYNPNLPGHKEDSKYYLVKTASAYIRHLMEKIEEDNRRRNSESIAETFPVSSCCHPSGQANHFPGLGYADQQQKTLRPNWPLRNITNLSHSNRCPELPLHNFTAPGSRISIPPLSQNSQQAESQSSGLMQPPTSTSMTWNPTLHLREKHSSKKYKQFSHATNVTPKAGTPCERVPFTAPDSRLSFPPLSPIHQNQTSQMTTWQGFAIHQDRTSHTMSWQEVSNSSSALTSASVPRTSTPASRDRCRQLHRLSNQDADIISTHNHHEMSSNDLANDLAEFLIYQLNDSGYLDMSRSGNSGGGGGGGGGQYHGGQPGHLTNAPSSDCTDVVQTNLYHSIYSQDSGHYSFNCLINPGDKGRLNKDSF